MVNEKPRTALAVRGFMLVMNNLLHGYLIQTGSQKASQQCEAFFVGSYLHGEVFLLMSLVILHFFCLIPYLVHMIPNIFRLILHLVRMIPNILRMILRLVRVLLHIFRSPPHHLRSLSTLF